MGATPPGNRSKRPNLRQRSLRPRALLPNPPNRRRNSLLLRRSQHRPPYPSHPYTLFCISTLRGGAPHQTLETTAVDFFAENNIPPLSLPRVTPIQIEHMFNHRRHPEWPTSFD